MTFELFSTDGSVQAFLGLKKQDSFDMKYATVGFDSAYTIGNMGIQAQILIIATLLKISEKALVFYLRYKRTFKNERKKLEKLGAILRNFMVFLVYHNAALISMTSMIGFASHQVRSFGEFVTWITAFLLFSSLFAMAALLVFLYFYWQYIIVNKKHKQNLDVLFSRLSQERRQSSLWWVIYFILRRFVLSFVIVYFALDAQF